MGVGDEDVGIATDAGAVNVLFGGRPSELSAAGNQFWHQNSLGLLDDAEAGDLFGHALSAGDFNGSGAAHLAVGVPVEDHWTGADVGAANVLYGGAAGLNMAGTQFWHQNSQGVLDAAEQGGLFGFALAP